MKTKPFLSKSQYLTGLQCHKLLWYNYNAKDEIPEVEAGTQAIFDQGHIVGEYAKKLYPGGIEVAEGIVDFVQVLEQSQKLISERKPLFEAAFKHKNAFARLDILNPIGKLKWDIIEVKSSSQVKDVNLHDLALQWYVFAGVGLTVKKCYLMHINNKYVRKGEINPSKLFTREDVTTQVLKYLPKVKANLSKMERVIAMESCPDISIGVHCSYPYECVMTDTCWRFLPKHNPTTLYRFKSETAFSLIEDGITDVCTLGDDVTLNAKQQIQINAIRSRRPHIDKAGIREFLDKLVYPLYYLDFETIGPAIPLFDNSRPYEQIPFQFSLHIQHAPGAKTEHIGFLAEGREDPRPELLGLLKSHLGANGSIVTYNESFEKGKLNKAAAMFPEYKKWNIGIQRRIVDLLAPFRAFHYYHPSQLGSASIKAVLPALTGKGYEGMAIADGGTASNEYLRVTFGEGVSEKERSAVRRNLEKYCELDTKAMVWIVEELRKLSA